jgi:hypothetical protein
MKTLVVAVTACLPMLAGERPAVPATSPAVAHALCGDTGNPRAKKPRKWHSPVYYLRLAGRAEVGAAIRLSSWGIHDRRLNYMEKEGASGGAAAPLPACLAPKTSQTAP